MNKVFEDEFMEVQSGLISLCLEVTEKNVDKVYAYCSIEKKSLSFNVFFEKQGEIKKLHELGIDQALIMQFLKLGTHDLKKIRSVCESHNMRTPTQIKMYYDVNTGKFDAQYEYEDICSAETGKDSREVFLEWIAEIKEQKVRDASPIQDTPTRSRSLKDFLNIKKLFSKHKNIEN